MCNYPYIYIYIFFFFFIYKNSIIEHCLKIFWGRKRNVNFVMKGLKLIFKGVGGFFSA